MLKTEKSSRVNKDALALSNASRASRTATSSVKPQKSLGSDSIEISDILTKRYGGVSIYAAVMLLIAAGVIWTAVLIAEQVQQYHEDYMALQDMKSEYRKLQIENQRLIIEQQTFSATPQIANRAVTELGMYSPTVADKLILQPAINHTQINPMINNTLSQDDTSATMQDNGMSTQDNGVSGE